MAEVSGHGAGNSSTSGLVSKRHRSTQGKPVCAISFGTEVKKCKGGPSLFCFGLGYTAAGLGHLLMREGWRVSGTCSSDEKAHSLRQEGFGAYFFHSERGKPDVECFEALSESSHVLISIPPRDESGRDDVLHHFGEFMAREMKQLQWVGFLSSTSVYGDWGGQLVDEDSECRATSEKARSRYRAERAWLELRREFGIPVHIFRLGGIYGPTRSILDRVSSNSLSESQERRRNQKYTARCHIYDVCQVLLASMKSPRPGRIYNVVDDNPSPPSVVEAFAKGLLAGEYPELPTASQGIGCIHHEGKRVSNRRIKEELGVKLAYPSFEMGLLSIYEGGRDPFL